jgi:hypothetical protein
MKNIKLKRTDIATLVKMVIVISIAGAMIVFIVKNAIA